MTLVLQIHLLCISGGASRELQELTIYTTIWYPAIAAKEDSDDDMNNNTQYANNVATEQ
jgi:hypothetical protein